MPQPVASTMSDEANPHEIETPGDRAIAAISRRGVGLRNVQRDSSPADAADLAFLEHLRAATELLESMAADWRLLDRLPADDRRRLHRAVAGLFTPDPGKRRKRAKAARRHRQGGGHEARRGGARSAPGFERCAGGRSITTPNVFPPGRRCDPRDIARRRAGAARRIGRCRGVVTSASRRTRSSIISTTSCVPSARDAEFQGAHGTGRPAGPGGAAHRRAREDRLSGRPQAAEVGRAPHRHDAFLPRRGGALCAGTGFRRVGGIVSRSSASICARRRGSKRSAASSSRRAAGWTSSSTMRARPCAALRISMRT